MSATTKLRSNFKKKLVKEKFNGHDKGSFNNSKNPVSCEPAPVTASCSLRSGTLILSLLLVCIAVFAVMKLYGGYINAQEIVESYISFNEKPNATLEVSNPMPLPIKTELGESGVREQSESATPSVSSYEEKLPLEGTKKSSSQKEKSAVTQKMKQSNRNKKAAYLKGVTPKKVFVDGRRIPPVELLPLKNKNDTQGVRVYLFDEFLSEAECDGLHRVHDKHVKEAGQINPLVCFDSVETLKSHLRDLKVKRVKISTKDFLPGTRCLNQSLSDDFRVWSSSNWSYSTAFYPGENKFSDVMAARVKEAMGLIPKHGGKFQITSYPEGIGYKSHTDCTENTGELRDRVATVLVYLNTVEEGGETQFPELGIWVKPRKGRALLWNNMNTRGECISRSIHQAARVTQGAKYILQRWYYYESFPTLGQRQPEPELPAGRTPGQPHVSCDEYRSGSCRWYDEWSHHHLTSRPLQ